MMQNNRMNSEPDFLTLSNEIPIVVDFWAEWCGPCRSLGPVLEKLEKNSRGRWRLLKINVEQNPEIAQQYNVRSIPAVKMFYEGKVISEFLGAQPEYQVQKWLEEFLPTEGKKLLESAKRAISNGNFDSAKLLFREIIESEPANAEARVLYAILLFQNDLKQAAELVQSVPEESPFYETAAAILTLARLQFERDDLKQQAKAAPGAKAAWDTYLTGAEAFSKKDYTTALEAWIEVMLLNRKLDDDGARKACVALFKLLGTGHELTQKYHRKFSMALH
jgi:putative thioredoxin